MLLMIRIQKRRRDTEKNIQEENRVSLRILRSALNWGVLKTTSSHTSLPTPASPPSAGVVHVDKVAAAFLGVGIIDRSHPLAAGLKSPAKNVNTPRKLDAALLSPGKGAAKSAPRVALRSPGKRALFSPRAADDACDAAADDHAAADGFERASASKVSFCVFCRSA
jgi:hypothetical protein